MQKFCHNCGKQLSVGAKFCSECGTSLSSLTAQPPAPTPSVSTAEGSAKTGQFPPFAVGREDDDDDDSYLDKMSHAPIKQSALHVDLVQDKPLGESVGAVITQGIGAGAPPTVDSARPAQATDSQSFIKSFEQEAGTMRKS